MNDPEAAVETGGLFLGMISGTSADGIDVALVRFGDSDAEAPQLLRARTFPLPAALRDTVLRVSQADALVHLDEFGELDTRLGQAFAAAALELLEEAGVDAAHVRAVGSHGQTLRHRPQGNAPFTLQVGDANCIAEATGIDTVADFRRRDVAAGGQGAPLVPAFHAATLRDAIEDRAVLNIGGIANLTLLPVHGTVRGFDTGPGNGLMDAWCLRHRGQPFDRAGAFAATGRADDLLLARLLAEPWLSLPPPKSTGRDLFHLGWLEARIGAAALTPADVQATLARFTARTIAEALRAELPTCARVLVCGGGVHNPVLLRELSAMLPGVTVESTAEKGLDPDFVEAMAFAWLAREFMARRAGNLAGVTGARGARVLGVLYPGANPPA
jgi:anhydro-N-acetylmuramic acid kinase